MGSSLQKRPTGTAEKVGIAACGLGAVASFIFVHWLLGVVLLGLGGFLFFKLMKIYASTGKRF